MIAALSGTVTGLWLDRAIISAGGVGFLVYATPRLLGDLRLGESATVSVAMVVREDALTLYAFPDDDERETFETIRSVTGIGPKIALALLAVHSPADLRMAIHGGDVKAIQRVPGIGPKTAQRVLLELGGKLVEPVPAKSAKGGGGAVDKNRSQVVEALVNLGYQAKAAETAIDEVLAERGSQGISDAEVPEILRLTLRSFGSKR
jgi:holliday junction DNA helicase RuvA